MEWQATFTRTSSPEPGSWPDLGPTEALIGSFDFDGPDFAGSVRAGPGGHYSPAAYVRIGGATFASFSGPNWWRPMDQWPTGRVPGVLDPLRGLTTAQIAYEAADSLDGGAVLRLRVSDALATLEQRIWQVMSLNPDLSISPGGRSDFIVYVDTKGIPLAAHVVLDVVYQRSPETPGVTSTMEFDYQYSHWGEPVTISPPQVSGAPGG